MPEKRSRPMASVSDLTYDLLTVLQSKHEACAAYDMYMKDCNKLATRKPRAYSPRSRGTTRSISRC